MPLEEGWPVEALQALDREIELLDRLRALVLGQEPGDLRVVGAGDGNSRRLRLERMQELAADIVSPGERTPAADRPVDRRGVERERFLDLVQEVERIARLAIHLVDEGDDRDVAQAADLEQLARARLDAFRGVDHHHRGVHGGQRAVGVLGEVLVTRRVEQVEDATAVFERHDRGDHGDPALALDAHPVGARLAAVRLGAHLARKLDRAAEQQHLFGERRLAGVRVRNDGEGAPPRDGVRVRHRFRVRGEKARLT